MPILIQKHEISQNLTKLLRARTQTNLNNSDVKHNRGLSVDTHQCIILHDMMFYLRTCWVIVIFKSKVHLMMLTGNNGGRRQRGTSWIRTILDLLTTEYKRRPARSFNLSRNTLLLTSPHINSLGSTLPGYRLSDIPECYNTPGSFLSPKSSFTASSVPLPHPRLSHPHMHDDMILFSVMQILSKALLSNA